MLTRYDDVSAVLRDPTVSSDLDKAAPSAVVDALVARADRSERDGMTLVLQDDPEHARLRRHIQAPFTARSIEQLRASVRERVDRHLDVLAPKGAMELIGDFAYPLPVEVFCEMLGIPEEASPRFRRWTAAVARSLDLVIAEEEYAACMVEVAEMEEYLRSVADRTPLWAEVRDGGLTPGELVAQLLTLYVAGHEPTTALVGNGMAALFAHPAELERLQADPSLVPAAVLELLRYDGPNQFVRRIAMRPMRIGDRDVAPGDVLYLGVGAANHDPARWGDDAESLRVTRADAAQHLQFGGGIHHCLGAHLARLQAEEALAAMFRRLPDLRPDGPVEWSNRMTLRSVSAVPLAFRV
jgi:cytochrome P450